MTLPWVCTRAAVKQRHLIGNRLEFAREVLTLRAKERDCLGRIQQCAVAPAGREAMWPKCSRAGYAAGGTAAKAVRLSMHFGSLRNVARSTGWLHGWPYCWLRSFRYLALNFVPRNASDLVLICNQL